jgi:hypothetical protein
MNDRPQDPELRARFEAQRRIDAGNAPSFAAMMARAADEAAATSQRTLPVQWLRRHRWTAGLAAAAAIAALIVLPRARSSDDEFERAVRAFQSDPALGAWQSPTDGLLHLPGDRLLSTIPSVGTVQ